MERERAQVQGRSCYDDVIKRDSSLKIDAKYNQTIIHKYKT